MTRHQNTTTIDKPRNESAAPSGDAPSPTRILVAVRHLGDHMAGDPHRGARRSAVLCRVIKFLHRGHLSHLCCTFSKSGNAANVARMARVPGFEHHHDGASVRTYHLGRATLD